MQSPDRTPTSMHADGGLVPKKGYNRWKRKRDEEQKEVDHVNIPEEYKCCMTQHIMVDPVTLTCGHTLERDAAEEWFRGSNRCPYDNKYATIFQSDHDLQREITTYVNNGPVLFKEQQRQIHDFRLIVGLWADFIGEQQVNRRHREDFLATNHTSSSSSSSFGEPEASCHVS